MNMNSVNSLAELRTTILQARYERDRVQKELRDRLELLNNPETRGILVRDAVGDALRAWKPFKLVHEALHGRVSGEAVTTVGMAAASLQGTWKKRLLWSGASWLLGKVIGDDPLKKNSLLDSIGNVLHKAKEAVKPTPSTTNGTAID